MPAYSIKPQFNEKILKGTKLFTLRNPRADGREPRAAVHTLYFYNHQRTKNARKIAERPCRFVGDVRMQYGWIAVNDWPAIIFPEHLDTFARLDGFEDYKEFCQFHGVIDGMKRRTMKLIAWAEEKSLRETILEKFAYSTT